MTVVDEVLGRLTAPIVTTSSASKTSWKNNKSTNRNQTIRAMASAFFMFSCPPEAG
jgi:hypothetical protein